MAPDVLGTGRTRTALHPLLCHDICPAVAPPVAGPFKVERATKARIPAHVKEEPVVNLAPIDQFIVSSNEVLGGNINNFLSTVTDLIVRFM